MAACVGCGGSGEVELKPDSSQADTHQKLVDMEAVVALDETGKIVSVEFDKPTHGDDVVELLKEIPTLKSISLSGSGITDAGLDKLQAITTLEAVGLEDTRVTPRAVRRLQEALPDTKIAYGDRD